MARGAPLPGRTVVPIEREEMAIPPIRTVITGSTVNVVLREDGGREIVIAHPLGQQWVVPMNAEAARQLAGLLAGGIDIAAAGDIAAVAETG